MTWTWRLEDSSGAALDEPSAPAQGSQADAESWLGENWRQLADAGVAQVTLLDGTNTVYGPMSLEPGQ